MCPSCGNDQLSYEEYNGDKFMGCDQCAWGGAPEGYRHG